MLKINSNFTLIRTIVFCSILLFLFPGCSISKKSAKNPKGMILIPASEFIMGTDKTDKENKWETFGLPIPWYEDEKPKRKIFLEAYYIDIHEVTMEQYQRFILETGHPPPPNWNDSDYPTGKKDYPVTFVNYYDAIAFSEWAGKRLPTEAEWEKAARGPNGKIYPWGNNFDPSYTNISYSKKNPAQVKPVGSFKKNISPYGVSDMVGNVWEWTSDWYNPYPGSNYKNKMFGRKYKVQKGLSWFNIGHFSDKTYMEITAYLSRASYREQGYPQNKSIDVGFRCVKNIKKL